MKRVQSNTTLPKPMKAAAQEYCEDIGSNLSRLFQELLEAKLRAEGRNPYPKFQPTASMGRSLLGM